MDESNNKPLFAHGADRKLRRGDVVELPRPDCFIPGRVWRRIDENHVQVIDTFQHITIFQEDHLKLSDYPGRWAWLRHPGNHEGNKPRWLPMTSLKMLKKYASRYAPHFGTFGGGLRARAERLEALANREVWTPRTEVSNIVWDPEHNNNDSVEDLPTSVIFGETLSDENIAIDLYNTYGCYTKSFTATPQPIAFPGYKKA